ncbi:MAG TPA: isocitrate lyase/phosphoenolpyruvate mutase family protein [Thermoanaerobaculia bacterium]|jgi:2-methylisocitrate lyase-like PEP mutase family enzyme|nr:isocitrate lyase/phosphoenolpyruvate mutase family protein [Thermoanaerobaculia bacterium]
MNQKEKAQSFASLHVKGRPLILYNVWDAGGAKAVAGAGAKAIASSSWSVAAAHGYRDGEAIPLDLVAMIVARIVATTDLPVSVDFEGGYATAPEDVASNVERVLQLGAVGINFEDRRVNQSGLFSVAEQSERIRAIRQRADEVGIRLFINARTDLFLQAEEAAQHRELLPAAKTRAAAYHDAGASGFFVPGLVDEELITELCAASPLPVNVMMMDGVPPVARLAELGVSRISFGPLPFLQLEETLREQARVASHG